MSYGETLARRARLQRRSVTITFAELTAAALTQSIDIGVALPAATAVVAHQFSLTDAFDSGGAASLDIQIGDDTVDDDSIVASFDAYTASANEGILAQGDTLGSNYMGPPTGVQLSALFTSTTDDVADMTAGSVTISVYFMELAFPE